MRLAELNLAVDELSGAQRDEDRVAVDLELGALMGVVRVLDGEIVQAETLLHGAQQILVRLVQTDPDEITALLGRTGLGKIDVGAPPPALICGTVDDAHGRLPQACNRIPTPRP